MTLSHSLSLNISFFRNEIGLRLSQVALVVKNPPATLGNIGDVGLIPGLGRSPGEGNSNLLQYSWLENSMDGGAW